MHLKPKKYLGQNFLFDKNIQRKIVGFCELRSSDIVFEIGAGRGELTQLIAKTAKKVYALEIDSNLCDLLKENLKKYKNIKIINQDILKFDFKSYFAKSKNKLYVIGNIPYYITTPIIEHLLKYRSKIDTIFISVQKEFARRMHAPCGSKDYGALSCFIQYYTNPKILFNIKKTSFFPVPRVDSSFVQLKLTQEARANIRDERLIFQIIRAAFNQRRKTLRNSLKGIVSPKKLNRFFEKYGIDINIRPEDLALKDFRNLANI